MDYKLTSRRLLKVGKACTAMLTLLLTLFFQADLFAQIAPVNPPTGGFNINGRVRVNSTVGDWFPPHPDSTVSNPGGSVFNEDNTPKDSATSGIQRDNWGSNDDVFTNGSKFNDYVSNLRWFTNSAPDKNDINVDMYHVSRDAKDSQWIFISGDRLSTNGTSYIDFELLQGTIIKNNDGTFTGTPVTSNTDSAGGGRTLNDIVISMEYTNGGSKPNVYIYQWKKSGNTWSYQQVPSNSLANDAFAETNRYGNLVGLPFQPFGTNTYQQYAFVEAGVNISYLLSLSGLVCTNLNIQTLWVKTKASASSTAALKDFIKPISVNFHFGSSSITSPTGPFCSNDNANYTLKATPPGGTFKVDGTTATTFNPYTAGTGSHTVTYSYSGCNSETTLVVYDSAKVNAGGPYSICSSDDSVSISGSYGGGATGVKWTTSGSGKFGNDTSASTKYHPSAADISAGSVTLTLTSTGQKSPCGAATSQATLTINPAATADAGGPYTICASDGIVNVSGTFGGGATGATWSTLGSGTFSNVSTNGSTVTATYTPSNADKTAGKVGLILSTTGQKSPCASVADTATLTIKPNPGAPTVTPTNNCDGTSILTASNYTGSLLWSTGSTTDTIHVNNNNTYTVVQTVDGCASPAGSGNATILSTPSAPSVTMLSVTCTDKTFSVQVNSPVDGTTYSLTQPGNDNKFDDITYKTGDAMPTFTGLTFGDGYSVIATNSDGCSSAANTCGSAPDSRLSSPTSIQNQPITLEKPVTDVKAVPNPYNNVIRFSLQSDVSGQGTLELYNLLGQKVKTVYQGFIPKGFKQTIDYPVPAGIHTNLIYLFRVGNERKSGILIGAK